MNGLKTVVSITLLLVSLGFGPIQSAHAETVYASADTYITSYSGLGGSGSIHGSNGDMYLNGGWSPYYHFPMVRFDLTAYSGWTVQGSATFELYLYSAWGGQPASQTVRVNEQFNDWDEATVSWSSLPGPHGTTGPTLDTRTISYPSARYVDWTIPASVVQSWIDSPDDNNGLIVISQTEGTQNDMVFHSREWVGGNPPRLTFSGTAPTAIDGLVRGSSGSGSCTACSDGVPPDPGLVAGYPRFTLASPDYYEDYVTLEGLAPGGVTLPILAMLGSLTGGVYALNPDGGGSGPPSGYWEYSDSSQDGKTAGVTAGNLPQGEKVAKIWRFADEGGAAFEFWVDVFTTGARGEPRVGELVFTSPTRARGSALEGDGAGFVHDDGTAEIYTGSASGAFMVANRFSASGPVRLRGISFLTSGSAAGDAVELLVDEDPTGTADRPDPTMEIRRTTAILEGAGFQEVSAGDVVLNAAGIREATFFVALSNRSGRSYTLGIDMTGAHADASLISTDDGLTFEPLAAYPVIDGNAMIRALVEPAGVCFLGAVL